MIILSKWGQHTIELIIACVILIGIAVFYSTYQLVPVHTHSHQFTTVRKYSAYNSPTLYFHGLQGSARSTNHLITVGSKTDGRKVMTINVERDGHILYRGHLNRKIHNPLVQVNFLDNTAPISKQVHWLHQILIHLKSKDRCNNYNAVAHSAGAVTVLEATDQFGQQERVAKLQKFVSIGGPYDGVIGMNDRDNENRITNNGKPEFWKAANRWYPSYGQLLKASQRFPANVKVLNIYGNLSYRLNSDQYVSTASARSLRYLLHQHPDNYQEVQIYGHYAQHSRLHHNSVVDRLVDRFIFNE